MTDDVNVALEELMPDEAGAAARDEMSRELRKAGGGLLALAGTLTDSNAVSALHSALRTVDPFEALAVAWSKVTELREYGNKRSSGTVRIGTHTLQRDLHPIVTFTVGMATSKDIRFTLKLDAQFSAVDLNITKGRIVEAVCGGCDLGSALRYGDAEIWPRHSLKRFAVPGRYILKGEGIALFD